MAKAARSGGLGAEVGRLVAGQICLHASMAGMRMSAALLALEQGRSKGEVGMLVALFALMQIVLSLPAGRFADRHGLRLPVSLSVVAATTAAALAALWPIYPVLCVAAPLSGGAMACASIALQRHVGKVADNPDQLRRAFAWVSMGPAIAFTAGPAVAGLIIDHAGYRSAFAALALLPLATAVLARSARKLPAGDREGNGQGSVLELVRQPGLRDLLVMNWFMSLAWDLHGFLVPVIGHDRGLQASAIGTILGAFAVGAASVRIAMPLLAARVREWVLVSWSIAVAGVLMLLYPWASTQAAMLVCSTLMGMALGGVQPMVLSMLHQVTPADRHGEALAVRLIMVNVSAVSTPLMLGAASALTGVAGIFWIVGAVVLTGSAWGPRLRAHTRDAFDQGGGSGA